MIFKTEVIYSSFTFFQGVGFLFGFLITTLCCTTVKIYIFFAYCGICFICGIILVIKKRREQKYETNNNDNNNNDSNKEKTQNLNTISQSVNKDLKQRGSVAFESTAERYTPKESLE